MYSREQLIGYDYFKEVLAGHPITDVLDPLTGLVSRAHMIRFVHSLMEANVPFTFGMIDLDNFKYFNDTYGHSVGDEILAAVSDALRRFLDGFGIAGRFGGDEFLFVNLNDLEYSAKKRFCQELFGTSVVLRKTYHFPGLDLFVTGTAGMATFPLDTVDYDELFQMLDKTLYRGKSKGRNCYIIYTPEKHKNIEIVKLKKKHLYDMFKNLASGFDSCEQLYCKMKAGFEAVKSDLGITGMYYVNGNNEMRTISDRKPLGFVNDIDLLMEEEVYATNAIEQIESISPHLYTVLKKNDFEALLIMRISNSGFTYGYIMCAEPHTLRIWQEDEFAVMFLFARLIGGYLSGNQLILE